MKPCRANRKRIALLAIESLAENEAEQLRNHFNICPGCDAYWQEITAIYRHYSSAAAELPSVTLDASFHQRLARSIHAEEPEPAFFAAFQALVRWRVAMSAAVVALLVLAVVFALGRRVEVPPRANMVGPVRSSISNSLATISESSYSHYRMAANTSLEALDELLTRQAARKAWPSEGLTVSTANRTGLDD